MSGLLAWLADKWIELLTLIFAILAWRIGLLAYRLAKRKPNVCVTLAARGHPPTFGATRLTGAKVAPPEERRYDVTLYANNIGETSGENCRVTVYLLKGLMRPVPDISSPPRTNVYAGVSVVRDGRLYLPMYVSHKTITVGEEPQSLGYFEFFGPHGKQVEMPWTVSGRSGYKDEGSITVDLA